VIPDTDAGLVEFFLDTDAREIEIEIGRLRPRLSQDFFGHVSREIAQIKFAVTRTAVGTLPSLSFPCTLQITKMNRLNSFSLSLSLSVCVELKNAGDGRQTDRAGGDAEGSS
jgi:hypothetical protein